jgi:hypothetical protein
MGGVGGKYQPKNRKSRHFEGFTVTRKIAGQVLVE